MPFVPSAHLCELPLELPVLIPGSRLIFKCPDCPLYWAVADTVRKNGELVEVKYKQLVQSPIRYAVKARIENGRVRRYDE